MSADPETQPPETLHNPPWLFGVLAVSKGLVGGVTSLLLPYLLRKAGVPVDRIASIVAIGLSPAVWFFLWSPLADMGFRRRTWALFSALGGGLVLGIAILGIHGSQLMLTALVFLASVFRGLFTSAVGGLLTGMPVSRRGRAAGWYQAGNIGGGAVGGGMVIWLADHASLPLVGVVISVAITLPALAVFLIDEPLPVRTPIGRQFAAMFHDIRDLFRSSRTWLALLFFLSPVGAAAVLYLISGLAPEYHASNNQVLWVTGLGGGLLTAVGCFAGGLLADRMNRMVAYALSGIPLAGCALYLGLARPTPFTFAAGYSLYCVAAGVAYAVFTALVLDVIGHRRGGVSTAYAVLNSSGNFPVSYMTWLDGVGYKHWGLPGLMGTDALTNGGGAILLLLVAAFASRYWQDLPRAQTAPDPSANCA